MWGAPVCPSPCFHVCLRLGAAVLTQISTFWRRRTLMQEGLMGRDLKLCLNDICSNDVEMLAIKTWGFHEFSVSFSLKYLWGIKGQHWGSFKSSVNVTVQKLLWFSSFWDTLAELGWLHSGWLADCAHVHAHTHTNVKSQHGGQLTCSDRLILDFILESLEMLH